MCGFSFTVFLSAFQLLPTAPFHILALGGSTFAAGLFLGFLTYASALSAPLTGSLADRLGQRRILIVASVAICCFFGLTASNIGIVYRMRVQVWLLWAVFIGSGWEQLWPAVVYPLPYPPVRCASSS